jgi:hypothetical protein
MNAKRLIPVMVLLLALVMIPAVSAQTIAFQPATTSVVSQLLPFNTTIYTANITASYYVIANISYPRQDLIVNNVFKNNSAINTVTTTITNVSTTQAYVVINASNTSGTFTSGTTLASLVDVQWYYINATSANTDPINYDPTYSQWYNGTFPTFSTITNGTIIGRLTSGFTESDLVMTPEFTLTVNFVDSVTNAPIPVVKVVDGSTGVSTNTTTGTFAGTYAYSTVVLYCYSDGYISKGVSYIVDSDKTETVQLVASTATQQSQNTNVVYSPTMIQFLFYDESLKAIPNAYVIATPLNFTAPSNWTTQLLGVSAGCNILRTSVYGWTDTAGSWSAPMVASVDYSITTTGTDNGAAFNYTFTLYPVQSPVHLTLPIGITAMPTASQISYGLNHTAINTTAQTVNMNYYDPSGNTTSLIFYVTNTTGSYLADVTYSGVAANSETFHQNITIAARGQAYTYGFSANQGTLGWINRSDSFVDPTFSLLGSGISPGVVELWFSIALLVIFGAVGSYYFKHIILIAEPILYWFIATYLSWLPLNTQVYFTLAVMLVLGVLIYIRYRENLIQ